MEMIKGEIKSDDYWAFVGGDWNPHDGDPSPEAWFIGVLYKLKIAKWIIR